MAVVFGSIPGLWLIQSPILGHPGSVGHIVPLMACALSETLYWLPSPTSFAPPLPKHILQAGQIVGQRFCG